MSFKSATAAATLMALASIFALAGCAGDECAKAADHVEECAPLTASTASTTATATGDFDSTAACEGLYLCQSQCTNNASCDSVKSVFGGKPSDSSASYQKCLDNCKTKSN